MRSVLNVVLAACVAAGIQPLQAQAHSHPQNTSAMAQHYGHGTPQLSSMTDMDQRSFSIEPLKGHWTLLYFWADWCVPCIREGIPALSEFVKQNAAQKDRFRIIGIRRNSTDEEGDWNSFKAKTAHLEEAVWHGVPPFPLVYDSIGTMTKDWGVHELPTYALIDPHGNLVRDGDLSTLKSALAHAR